MSMKRFFIPDSITSFIFTTVIFKIKFVFSSNFIKDPMSEVTVFATQHSFPEPADLKDL